MQVRSVSRELTSRTTGCAGAPRVGLLFCWGLLSENLGASTNPDRDIAMLLLGSPLYELFYLCSTCDQRNNDHPRSTMLHLHSPRDYKPYVDFFHKSCLKYTATLAVTMFNFPTNCLSNARRHWLLQTLCSISHK